MHIMIEVARCCQGNRFRSAVVDRADPGPPQTAFGLWGGEAALGFIEIRTAPVSEHVSGSIIKQAGELFMGDPAHREERDERGTALELGYILMTGPPANARSSQTTR